MTLQLILDKQLEFQKKLNAWEGILSKDSSVDEQKAQTRFIRDQVLYTIDELSEMMREIPYNKHWKDYSDFNMEKRIKLAQEEYIDALHFFANIGLALGLTEDTIRTEYLKKHGINEQRQQEGYGFHDSQEVE